MGMSKEAVLDAIARFKVLQDEQNAAKFVAKEVGKTLISESDVNKLAGIEKGAQKNPDLSGYATKTEVKTHTTETNEKIQAALTAAVSIFGGEYTPPEPDPDDTIPGGGDNPTPGGGDDTQPGGGGGEGGDDDNDDPDEGDENITDEEIKNMFGNN